MNQFSAIDLYNLEKKAAGSAVKKLRSGLRSAISENTSNKTSVTHGDKSYSYPNTGVALKTANSRAVFKENRLQRITIKAPHYIFKQHYGFEGQKKNGINMRLHATTVIGKALEKANVLETLASDIGEIRMDAVTAKINFK